MAAPGGKTVAQVLDSGRDHSEAGFDAACSRPGGKLETGKLETGKLETGKRETTLRVLGFNGLLPRWAL